LLEAAAATRRFEALAEHYEKNFVDSNASIPDKEHLTGDIFLDQYGMRFNNDRVQSLLEGTQRWLGEFARQTNQTFDAFVRKKLPAHSAPSRSSAAHDDEPSDDEDEDEDGDGEGGGEEAKREGEGWVGGGDAKAAAPSNPVSSGSESTGSDITSTSTGTSNSNSTSTSTSTGTGTGSSSGPLDGEFEDFFVYHDLPDLPDLPDLGQDSALEQGMERDPAAAANYFERAAQQGNGEAM
jgi:hypothetical protein